MIKKLVIVLGVAAFSAMPSLAHAQTADDEYPPPRPPVEQDAASPVRPESPGRLPENRAPLPADPGTLSQTGSDATSLLLQLGVLMLVGGGIAVVATH